MIVYLLICYWVLIIEGISLIKHMWSYQVERAWNSTRALWRNQLPKMTSTSLTLPRNQGKSVRRRRIFRVADRWSPFMFQTILFHKPHLPYLVYRALFICHLFFKLLWFSYKFPDKPVCYKFPLFSTGLWHSWFWHFLTAFQSDNIYSIFKIHVYSKDLWSKAIIAQRFAPFQVLG